MDISVSVKDGKDVELDGVTVINTLSVAEKVEEKKEEPQVSLQSNVAAEPAVISQPQVDTQTPVTYETTIASLNPTIPNIEIPVPNVPTSIEPSPVNPIVSPLPEQPTVTTPDLSNVKSVTSSASDIANIGGMYNYNNQYETSNYDATTPISSTLEQEVGSSVFKSSDSVTSSRNHFLDEVGKIFDERLTSPVNTSVFIANESMKLLNDVFQHGMNVSSFKKYQELTDLYNGIKNVEDIEKDNYNNDSYDNYSSGRSYSEDLSRMNIPRF